MKTTYLFLIALLVFTSCKKHELGNILQRSSNEKVAGVTNPLSYCNDGNPVGGGSGYSSIINPAQADVVVSSSMSAANFKLLIESSANKIIYINPNVVIDLTGFTQTIKLPSNIVIASNRGSGGSLGALIKTNTACLYYGTCNLPTQVFLSDGNNIRITGIRLQGPFGDEGTESAGTLSRVAIWMIGHDGLEVDNCELSAWPESAIYIGSIGSGNQSNNNNNIHHNYIRSNKQKSLGYGVCVNNGYALIKANVFEANRHDIACSGYRNSNNTGYEASCNVILEGGTSHNFDVHGSNQDAGPNASTFFYIHHNYFIDLGMSRYDGVYENVVIRGIPDNQCRVENNLFKRDGPVSSIRQMYYYGNLLAFNNVYGYGLNGAPGSYLGWYLKPTWTKKGVNNFMNIQSSNDVLLSSIGDPNVIDYALGDYDGDGKTDIYKLQNGVLYVMPYEITNGLTQGWTQILTTEYSMSQFRFGHYNSDNKTDLIVRDGNDIYVSYGCNSGWVLLNTTSYPMSSIYSGDLTGDGIQDFFCAYSGSWMIVDNATPNSSWITIANRNENSNVLKLGWFDLNTTNNKIDVFLANGANFFSAYDGTQAWTQLTGSTYLPSTLYVYDFNSDGVSDVINAGRQVSLKGRDSWANSTLNNFPLSTFAYGDFN